jgi:hypothetical protein
VTFGLFSARKPLGFSLLNLPRSVQGSKSIPGLSEWKTPSSAMQMSAAVYHGRLSVLTATQA